MLCIGRSSSAIEDGDPPLTLLVQFPHMILHQQMLAVIMKMPFFATTTLVTRLIVQVNLSLQQVCSLSAIIIPDGTILGGISSLPRNKHQQLSKLLSTNIQTVE